MSRPYKRRKVGGREEKRVVHIVSEGSVDEVSYFNSFNSKDVSVKVLASFEGHTDVKNIVKKAEEGFAKHGINLEEGDGVWVVFDADEKRDEDIRNYSQRAERKGIGVGFSNPCFEIWYILHFEYLEASQGREDVQERLKRHIPDYEKGDYLFSQLYDKITDAIVHAKRLNRYHEGLGNIILSRASNPSTQIFTLIEFIQGSSPETLKAPEGDTGREE